MPPELKIKDSAWKIIKQLNNPHYFVAQIKRLQSSWDDVINHQELLVYNRLFLSFHLIAKAAVDPGFPDSNKRDFIENMREIKLNYIYLLPANFEIRHSIK
ncbi:hypothetical protein AVEN_120973-1 [Araneus ventricosus]|uniref:Uncharacterized protein n=1 Tax=Araneus ventricosus TaxID=182803 RepID=A0A4Y2SQG3_ARAVE|nr:hypothetical protein AVEN_120973-1 [Araneus ventricosus]